MGSQTSLFAAARDCLAPSKKLWAAGIQMSALYTSGQSVLQIATQCVINFVVEKLWAAGTNVNRHARSRAHITLRLAAKDGHIIVSRLKQAGAKE